MGEISEERKQEYEAIGRMIESGLIWRLPDGFQEWLEKQREAIQQKGERR